MKREAKFYNFSMGKIMIPIFKLKTLPRSQRLRKAASLVKNAEHRLTLSEQFSTDDAEYFFRLAEYLASDAEFSNAPVDALKAAQAVFASVILPSENEAPHELTAKIKEIRRALNNTHHILLSETGKYQADWDFLQAPGLRLSAFGLDSSKRKIFSGMQIYLEDIRSPFNVGSIFRAADSFGVEKIWLSPLCADPRHKRAERTAMGCVDVIPWERLSHEPFASDKNECPLVPAEFSSGVFFALETGGIPLAEFPFPEHGILIAGSEELGVSPQALSAADASLGRVTIPTHGVKGSLNVSVAFGIVMQAWAVSLDKS